MADIRISNLPTYTGDTTSAYLVMNDSGNTTTYKVLKENVVGTSLTYDELTRIPQDMVWDISLLGSGGEKMAGGLMYNYTTATPFTLTTGTTYGNTIILEPGETLDRVEFTIPNYTSPGSMNIGLYSIVERSSLSGTRAYAVGELLHTITTGYAISGGGDKVITSINFTAQQGETKNNVYFVAFQIVETGFTLPRLASNNLIPHIMGGAGSGSTFYRTLFNRIENTGSSLPADLSTGYTIMTDTQPGMFFTYKTT